MVKVNDSGNPKVTGRRVEPDGIPSGSYCEYFTYEDITFIAYRRFTEKTGNVRKIIHRCRDCITEKNRGFCNKHTVRLRWSNKGHFYKCDRCRTGDSMRFIDWNGTGQIDSQDIGTSVAVEISDEKSSSDAVEDPRTKQPSALQTSGGCCGCMLSIVGAFGSMFVFAVAIAVFL